MDERATRPIEAREGEAYDRCRRIYEGHADAYDRLIAVEDCDGNLLPAITSVTNLQSAELLDVGAGTGRLARLLAPHVVRVTAVDRALPMLEVAQAHLATACAQADARVLPFRDATFDLATAGWAFGHFTFWDPEHWEREIGSALDEMQRVARPDGTVIVFENMGTASEKPGPPARSLAAYYDWLENVRGFERKLVATDFEFESVEAAAEACGFFFGDEFAERIRTLGWRRVPEWTGMWWKRVRSA